MTAQPLTDIEDRIRPLLPRLAALDATVKIAADTAAPLYIDATTSPAGLSRDNGPADCTLRLSAETLRRLMDGKLDPMLAYTLGKLKVSGRTGLALKLSTILRNGEDD